MDLSTGNNAWVGSYLDAIMSFGLSHEHVGLPHTDKKGSVATKQVDADRHVAQKYYVQQILHQSEESLKNAWAKAATKAMGEKDERLQNASWRAWGMKRRRANIAQARQRASHGAVLGDEYEQDLAESAAMSAGERRVPKARVPRPEQDNELGEPVQEEERGRSEVSTLPVGVPIPGLHLSGLELPGVRLPGSSLTDSQLLRGHDADEQPAFEGIHIDTTVTPETTSTVDPILVNQLPSLYILLISMHGLIRGERMELGRDPDTGGQVKYVVELAKALGRVPSVCRVDLLTRLVDDPSVDEEYSVPQERIDTGVANDDNRGAFIVRLPCGPSKAYLRKEDLWPHVREFADRAVEHVSSTLMQLQQDGGTPVELFAVHGHYADAGETAALVSNTLGVDMVLTGHSLGRNKLEHLMKAGTMTASEVEATYRISRRIEGEERALDAALVVFTSTHQEVVEQWGLYDGFGEQLRAALQLRPVPGYHVPKMAVVPPGLDFSNLKVRLPNDPWDALLGGGPAADGSNVGSPKGSSTSLASSFKSCNMLGGGGGSHTHLASLDAHNVSTGGAASPPRPVRARAASPARTGASSPRHPSSAKASGLSRAASGGGFGSNTTLSAMDWAINDGSPEALAAALAAPGAQQPPVWRDIFRFLRNPHKPAILAMCRPDAKKNVATLLHAYGSSKVLRELANLVLILGNRDIISAMAPGSKSVMNTILLLIDDYDLYGSVAYPKHHTQNDISDIYLLATATKGVFVNIALQEPFGLTLIEAAAHGAPIVATSNGGPVDIISTLQNGQVVEPTDRNLVTQAIINVIIDTSKWEEMSSSGRAKITAYSWPAHCAKCLRTIKDEMDRSRHYQVGGVKARNMANEVARHNFSLSLEDFSSLLDADIANDGETAHNGDERPPLLRHGSMQDFMTEPDSLMESTASDGGASHFHGQINGQLPRVVHRKRVIVVVADVPADLAALPAILEAVRSAESNAAAAHAAPQASLDIGKLRAELLADGDLDSSGGVGVGLMCPWALAEARQLMQDQAGVPMTALDFLVCESGAMLWHVAGGLDSSDGTAKLMCDEEYERHMDFRWDSQKVKQVLTGILGNSDGWGKLAVVPTEDRTQQSQSKMLNSEPKQGNGISLRLLPGQSPWSFNIAVALSSPGTTDVHPMFRADTLLSLMRRKLRRCGMRTQMLLTPGRPLRGSASGSQLHAGIAHASAGGLAAAASAAASKVMGSMGVGSVAAAAASPGPLATLCVTPHRASRPLALRFLAYRNKLPLKCFTSVVFRSNELVARKGADASLDASTLLQFGANDIEDFVGGIPRCVVLPPFTSTTATTAAAERAAVSFSLDTSVYAPGKVSMFS